MYDISPFAYKMIEFDSDRGEDDYSCFMACKLENECDLASFGSKSTECYFMSFTNEERYSENEIRGYRTLSVTGKYFQLVFNRECVPKLSLLRP